MTKLEATWKTAQGMRTLTTTKRDDETFAQFLTRHGQEVADAQQAFPIVE